MVSKLLNPRVQIRRGTGCCWPRHRIGSTVWLFSLLLLLGGFGTEKTQAAQQTFWSAYEWPPRNWSFASTDAVPIIFVNGAANLYTRRFNLGHLTNPITPPAPNSSAVYSSTNSILSFEWSGDRTTWYPAQTPPNGTVRIQLSNTNADYISVELLGFSGTATSMFGAFPIRENPTKASSGQTVLIPTNGGYLISGFIDARWLLSFNGGTSYKSANFPAHLELTGPSGQIGPLLASLREDTFQICWPTQIDRQYQLQWAGRLGATNWTNLGPPAQGTGSNMCASDSVSGQTSRFYRVLIPQ
jgi:hypothetical protein